MKKLRWGILGTGAIARRFARALSASTRGQLEAVGSRDAAKARTFAAEFKAPSAHGSYAELLADAKVDAVYISTPHPDHVRRVLECARAGKHILCEKPLAMNAEEACTAITAAREAGVFLMEAFMYRCHPQTRQLVDLLGSGVIGKIRLIQATFSFNTEYNPQSRLINRELGGGGILDVGCYTMSMARLIAGIGPAGRPAEPLSVKGSAILDPQEKTDLIASATLQCPDGILAQLNCGVQLQQECIVRVWGSEGWLTVTQPWMPDRPGARLIIQGKDGKLLRDVPTEAGADLYSYEIDLVAEHASRGQAPYPAMTWDDSLGNLQALDAWRREAGVVYDSEK